MQLFYITCTRVAGARPGYAGPCFNIKTIFPGMGKPVLKIRQSWDHLIFIVKILLLIKRPFCKACLEFYGATRQTVRLYLKFLEWYSFSISIWFLIVNYFIILVITDMMQLIFWLPPIHVFLQRSIFLALCSFSLRDNCPLPNIWLNKWASVKIWYVKHMVSKVYWNTLFWEC